MKIMKFFILAAIVCLVGCGGGSDDLPELNNPETEKPSKDDEELKKKEEIKKQVTELKKALCYDGMFVEREFKESTSNGYESIIVVKQKNYTFTSDGKGKVITYIPNSNIDRGYNLSKSDIEWSIAEELPLSLKVKTGSSSSFTLENVSVADNVLKAKDTEWLKEIKLKEGLKNSDVKSYSVENMNSWHKKVNESESRVYFTPSILSVNTEKGTARFIMRSADYGSVGYLQPTWEKVEHFVSVGKGFFDCNIYFYVLTNDTPVFDVIISKDERAFAMKSGTATGYNFYIGNITSEFVLETIDNNKSYNVEN